MTFEAADAGTSEEEWRASGYRAGLPPLDTGPLRRLTVVAAHPDDETLMAGGLIAHAAARGVPVRVVLVSNGEASHPDSPTWLPEALARVREEEARAAVALLAPDADVRLLRLPDGALADHEPDLTATLLGLVEPSDTVVSTWRNDGHPDHAAVGRAAAAASSTLGALHLEAPIWAWHWGTPAEVAWPRAVRLDLDRPTLEAKRAALALHVTQIAPLSLELGDEVLLHERMLEHFRTGSEVFFVGEDAQPVDFDAMYGGSDDPWGFADRWYEQRKRAVLMAALPRRRFRRALEIGCSAGLGTEALAERADAVVAIDVAQRAVEQARIRLQDRPSVSVEQRRLPDEWNDAWDADQFDLVVLSEVGFYLAGDALDRVVIRSRAALAPGGVFVACHWRPHVLGLDRGGDAVHRVIGERIDARRLVLHLEDDFVLEVFQTEPSPSVAQSGGLR